MTSTPMTPQTLFDGLGDVRRQLESIFARVASENSNPERVVFLLRSAEEVIRNFRYHYEHLHHR